MQQYKNYIHPTYRPMGSSILNTRQTAHGMHELPAHTDNITVDDLSDIASPDYGLIRSAMKKCASPE
jgi:hypothetical protein